MIEIASLGFGAVFRIAQVRMECQRRCNIGSRHQPMRGRIPGAKATGGIAGRNSKACPER